MTTEAGELPDAIVQHRETTAHTVDALRHTILAALGDQAEAVIGDHTTFILTGSAGRGEMTKGSDIDGHVVRVGERPNSRHDALLLRATGYPSARSVPEVQASGRRSRRR